MPDTLQNAKAAAARRFAELGEVWLRSYDVRLRKARSNLTGRAWAKKREIEAPWPTTSRRRLYILAHEIGHVVIGHHGQRPVYVQEYEAELFAAALLREHGVSVPRDMTSRAKAYVASKIGRAIRRSALWIDPEIADWAGTDVSGVNYATTIRKGFDADSRARVFRAIAKAEER